MEARVGTGRLQAGARRIPVRLALAGRLDRRKHGPSGMGERRPHRADLDRLARGAVAVGGMERPRLGPLARCVTLGAGISQFDGDEDQHRHRPCGGISRRPRAVPALRHRPAGGTHSSSGRLTRPGTAITLLATSYRNLTEIA